jgi:molecular chaperone DnaK
MARTTIGYGADLGTTNSSIALVRGTHPEVFRNVEGFEYTPSAVSIDAKGKLHVGRRAKESVLFDPANAFTEFKGAMGQHREYVFERSGRRFTPPQLSAEVLKSLKGDAERRSGEPVDACVITIPAAFELPQCEATRQAATLAGFVESPLLQEPVAAALAYGFQSDSDRVFWLVYDFGGGTFDAALVHMRDESIQVVNHGGDNDLGGKHLDWAIVEQLLIPALTQERRLTDFRRGNPKWTAAIAKLKIKTEEAKIRLSREGSTDITFDGPLCVDDRGEPIEFEFELTRAQVENLAAPLILRSVNICRKVLAERRLSSGDVEKVLLVGGPTLAPYFQRRLSSELGIPLEFEKDPLTVVAQGASVFASTQRLTATPVSTQTVSGGLAMHLFDFKPVGGDPEPAIGGRIEAPDGRDLTGYTIEFVNSEARPEWRSGKVGLGPTGGFLTNLWAQRGRTNTYVVDLRDASGRQQPVHPASVPYTIGIGISEAPLVHSVGVALANNEVDWLLKKGTPLPNKGKTVLRTVQELRRGQTGQTIRIPAVEGQNRRADRNQLIGQLEITAAQITRDVPVGSEVEVTMLIDASRMVVLRAYLPILDEEFDATLNTDDYRKKAKDPSEMAADLDRQKKRIEEARRKAGATNDPTAAAVLQRIDGERLVYDADAALAAAQGDADAADRCAKRVLELKAAVDEVDDALEWPALVAQAEQEIEVERSIINHPSNNATPDERTAFATLEREIRETFGSRDVEALRRKLLELERLGFIIMLRQPAWWVAQFQHLEKRRNDMTSAAQADDYIAQARRAINTNDFDALRAAVTRLAGLLPAGDAERERIIDSTVQR